jgi:hypothetical protein
MIHQYCCHLSHCKSLQEVHNKSSHNDPLLVVSHSIVCLLGGTGTGTRTVSNIIWAITTHILHSIQHKQTFEDRYQ